ncbi:hypothetical protein Landi51_13810 [Colletotrichum acutatum]
MFVAILALCVSTPTLLWALFRVIVTMDKYIELASRTAYRVVLGSGVLSLAMHLAARYPSYLRLIRPLSIGNISCQCFKHALGRAFWCRDPLMGNSRNLLMPTRPHELMNLPSLLRRLEDHTGFGFEIRIPTCFLIAKKHGIGVALVCRQAYGQASPSVCEK